MPLLKMCPSHYVAHSSVVDDMAWYVRMMKRSCKSLRTSFDVLSKGSFNVKFVVAWEGER